MAFLGLNWQKLKISRGKKKHLRLKISFSKMATPCSGIYPFQISNIVVLKNYIRSGTSMPNKRKELLIT
jgi:hypothetical protein